MKNHSRPPRAYPVRIALLLFLVISIGLILVQLYSRESEVAVSVPSAVNRTTVTKESPNVELSEVENDEAAKTEDLPVVENGGGKVVVYVIGRDGAAARGVSMTLASKGPGLVPEPLDTGETGGNGEYLAEGLLWGEYLVMAKMGELVARVFVKLSPASPTAFAELTLSKGGTITGVVLDNQGTPVLNAQVKSLEVFGRIYSRPLETLSDENGEFVLSDAPSGLYRLQVSAPGYAPVISVELVPDSAPVRIVLTKGGALKGTVRSIISREPLAGVDVRIVMDGFEGLEQIVSTDKEGNFSAIALPLGPCYLTSVGDEQSFVPTRTEALISNERIAQIEILVEESAKVAGTISEGTTGEPISGAFVSVCDLPLRTRYWRAGPTGADGNYVLNGLPSGDCEVRIERFPMRYSANSDDVRRTLQLQAGEQRDDIDFQLFAGTRVEGIVIDEAGTPVFQSRVMLELGRADKKRSPFTIATYTDADGKFCFPDAGSNGASVNEGGEYNQNLEGSSVAILATFRSQRSETLGPIELPTEGLSDIILQLKATPGGAISGYVTDSAGNPIFAYVTCNRGNDGIDTGYHLSRSDHDGSFLLNHLSPGTYRIYAAPYDGSGTVPNKEFIQDINLAEGQRVTDMLIVLNEGRAITGVLRDVEGRAINGQVVTAISIANEDDSSSASTKDDGRFSILNLEDGEYYLSTKDGNSGSRWTQTVMAGDVVEITIQAAGD